MSDVTATTDASDEAEDEAETPEVLPATIPVGHEQIPAIPEHSELTTLAQLAVTFAQAGLVPKPLQGKPSDVLLVLLTGRGLGIDPMVALRECHPIDGRVTVSPKLRLAIVRDRGLGQIWPDPENNDDQAIWYGRRADQPDTVFTGRYSKEDAQRAGLQGKDNWKKYPRQMLQWRALGYLLDQAFPEVGTGLYGADELGAITDEEGRPIEISEVEPFVPSGRRQQGGSKEDPPADEATKALLVWMLAALPEEAAEVRRQRWHDAIGVKVADLTAKQAKQGRALVDSLWTLAAKGEWGEWAPPFDPDAPATAPVEAPEGESGTEGHEEAPEAHTDAQGGETAPPRDRLDEIIAEVKEMSVDDVISALAARGIDKDGSIAVRRRRLAEAIARDEGVV